MRMVRLRKAQCAVPGASPGARQNCREPLGPGRAGIYRQTLRILPHAGQAKSAAAGKETPSERRGTPKCYPLRASGANGGPHKAAADQCFLELGPRKVSAGDALVPRVGVPWEAHGRREGRELTPSGI